MSNNSPTKKFISEISPYKDHLAEKKDLIDEYVEEMMPGSDPKARAALTKMIYDNKFIDFARRIMFVKEKGAQEVLLDYIGQGSAEYEKKATIAGEEARSAMKAPNED